MVNNEELARLIRDVSEAVDNHSGPGSVAEVVAPLREHVLPNCHIGCGAQMDATDEGYRLQMEWYAGQLLTMVDEQQWFGINTWINCTDKFTTRASAPQAPSV